MEELRFSPSDIEGLAGKLSEFLTNLPPEEQLLLLAILRVAAENAYQPVPTPDTITVEEFRTQIIKSFAPDREQEFVMHVKRPPHKIGHRTFQKPPE